MMNDLVAPAHAGDLMREACRARLAKAARKHRRTSRRSPLLPPVPCTD